MKGSIKYLFWNLLILFATIAPCVVHAATFNITEPTGQVEKIFTIRATALADPGSFLGYMKVYLNGIERKSVSCSNGACEIVYPTEECTGTHTISLAAYENGVTGEATFKESNSVSIYRGSVFM